MKKIATGTLIAIFLIFASVPGFCNTVFFAVDNTIDLDLMDGFDIFTTITDPIQNLTLDINYQAGGGAVPDNIAIGTTTIFMWDIFLTNYGATGDNANGVNLVPGIVLSLTDTSSLFAISSIDLLSNDNPLGFYDLPYSVIQSEYQGGTLYTVSAVPIPPAILLLGSGLVGLVGIRRKMRK